jgi:hypothetical protein
VLKETKVKVRFTKPIKLPDINDGELFTADKHWIMASYCEQDAEETRFKTNEGRLIARFTNDLIAEIQFPVLSEESEILRSRQNRKYVAQVKKVKPAAWSKWTEDEEIQLFIEVERGLSLATMAEIHNRSEAAIWMRLFRLDIYEGYEYPDYGVKIPVSTSLEVSSDLNGTKTTCLNCGLPLEIIPCPCWLLSPGH